MQAAAPLLFVIDLTPSAETQMDAREYALLQEYNHFAAYMEEKRPDEMTYPDERRSIQVDPESGFLEVFITPEHTLRTATVYLMIGEIIRKTESGREWTIFLEHPGHFERGSSASDPCWFYKPDPQGTSKSSFRGSFREFLKSLSGTRPVVVPQTSQLEAPHA